MAAVPASAPAQQTSLQASGLRLIGTIEGPALTGAVIEDAAGVQSFYRLQENLPDGSKLHTVRDDSIVIKLSDGTLFDLFVSQGPSKSAARPRSSLPDSTVTDMRSPDPVPGRDGPPKQQRSRHLIEGE